VHQLVIKLWSYQDARYDCEKKNQNNLNVLDIFPVAFTFFLTNVSTLSTWDWPRTLYQNTIKIKRNRSLHTNNGLLAKMESSYVTTCFSLHLWPSSGYNLIALRFYTGCPTRYRTRHFFNNSKTNKDIAMKFEQQYVHCRHVSYAIR